MRKLAPIGLLACLMILGCDDGSNVNEDPDAGDAGNDPDGGGDTDVDTETSTWDEVVDEFWGDAPDEETRLEMFDYAWDNFANYYSCFDSYNVDWA